MENTVNENGKKRKIIENETTMKKKKQQPHQLKITCTREFNEYASYANFTFESFNNKKKYFATKICIFIKMVSALTQTAPPSSSPHQIEVK